MSVLLEPECSSASLRPPPFAERCLCAWHCAWEGFCSEGNTFSLAGVNQVCLMHQEKFLHPASCFQTEEEIRVEKTLHTFAGFFSAFFFFLKPPQLRCLKTSNKIFLLPHLLPSRTVELSVHVPLFLSAYIPLSSPALFILLYRPFSPSTCILQEMTFQ